MQCRDLASFSRKTWLRSSRSAFGVLIRSRGTIRESIRFPCYVSWEAGGEAGDPETHDVLCFQRCDMLQCRTCSRPPVGLQLMLQDIRCDVAIGMRSKATVLWRKGASKGREARI